MFKDEKQQFIIWAKSAALKHIDWFLHLVFFKEN